MWSNSRRDMPGWAEAFALLADAGLEIFDPGPDDLSEERAAVLADADALIVGLNRVSRQMLAQAERVRVIAKPGIGTDLIDLDAATESGIFVCNTPGSNSDAVADHAIALALAVLRNVVELDAATRSGHGWERDWPRIGRQLSEGVIAVIGTGNIGKAVIKRIVCGFGATAVAFDLVPDPQVEERFGVRYGPLEEILPQADVVTVHLPLSSATCGLIGEPELELLKPSAVIVNTARGGIIDERALAEALIAGRIAGAGIDVFEVEPCVDSPLFSAPNIVLTPHVAGYSEPAARRSRIMTAENVVRGLAGNPTNLVNPEVLTARPLLR